MTRHPTLSALLATGDEIDADHARQQKMMEKFFETYEIDRFRADAWQELAWALAREYVPGFSSTRKQGRPAGQPDDHQLMMMIELLRRRHRRWSIPMACAAIAKVRAIDKSAKALQDRYKVLRNRDRHWKTLLDGWSADFLEAQVGNRLAGVEKNLNLLPQPNSAILTPRATTRRTMLDRVMTLKQAADATGLSVATLRRLIDRGEGPAVTQLSDRRVGFRESHLSKWLNARVRDHDDRHAA
jgi:predicted DNA-binding transcriptional regulator AlpA